MNKIKPQYSYVSGYWIDNGDEFTNMIIQDTHGCNGEDDEAIFFYGLDRDTIKKSIENKTLINGEFVLTEVH